MGFSNHANFFHAIFRFVGSHASFDLFSSNENQNDHNLNFADSSSRSSSNSSLHKAVPFSLLNATTAPPTTKLTSDINSDFIYGSNNDSRRKLGEPSRTGSKKSGRFSDAEKLLKNISNDSPTLGPSKGPPIAFDKSNEYPEPLTPTDDEMPESPSHGSAATPLDRGEYLPGANKPLNTSSIPAFTIEDYLEFMCQISEEQIKELPFSVRRKLRLIAAGTATENDIKSVSQSLDPILYFNGWTSISERGDMDAVFDNLDIPHESLEDSSSHDGLGSASSSSGSNSLTSNANERSGSQNNISSGGSGIAALIQNQHSDSNIRTSTRSRNSNSNILSSPNANLAEIQFNDRTDGFITSPSPSQPVTRNASFVENGSFRSRRGDLAVNPSTTVQSSPYVSSPLATSPNTASILQGMPALNPTRSSPMSRGFSRSSLRTSSSNISGSFINSPHSIGFNRPVRSSTISSFGSDTGSANYSYNRPQSEGLIGGEDLEVPSRFTSRKSSNRLAHQQLIPPGLISGSHSANLRRARSSVNRSASVNNGFGSFSNISGINSRFSSTAGSRNTSRRNSMFQVGSVNDPDSSPFSYSSAAASPALQYLARLGSSANSPIDSRRGSAGGPGMFPASTAGSISSFSHMEGMAGSAMQGNEDLGAQVGNYIIGSQLGYGGFSVVREARTIDEKTGKEVVRAVKIMEAKARAIDLAHEKIDEIQRDVDKELKAYEQQLQKEEEEQREAMYNGIGSNDSSSTIGPKAIQINRQRSGSAFSSYGGLMSPLSPFSSNSFMSNEPSQSIKEKVKEHKVVLQQRKIHDALVEQSDNLQAQIDHEVLLWKELDHPNILKLRDVVTKSNNPNRENGDPVEEEAGEEGNIHNISSSGLMEAQPITSRTRSSRSGSVVSSNSGETRPQATDLSSINVGIRTYCFSDKITGGTLYDLVKEQHKIGLNLFLVVGYAKQLADAILYLHEVKKVVHRDVKLENCLIESNESDGLERIEAWKKTTPDALLLCDFGMSEFFYEEKDQVEEEDTRDEAVFDNDGDLKMREKDKRLGNLKRATPNSSDVSLQQKIVGPSATSSIMNQYHKGGHRKPDLSEKLLANKPDLSESTRTTTPYSLNSPTRPISRSASLVAASNMISSTTTVDHFGSVPYASPEVLASPVPLYNPCVDIWSFGVVLYALIMGELPWSHPLGPVLRELIQEAKWDKTQVRNKLVLRFKEAEISEDRVDQLMELLQRILEKDPTKRITIREIVDRGYLEF